MKIQLFYAEKSYLPELEYLCRLISSISGMKIIPCHMSCVGQKDSFSIGYCSRKAESHLPGSCKIRIYSDDVFWQQYLRKEWPEIGKREHSGLVVLNTDKTDPYFIRNSDGIITNLDLFSSAFFMITGMEEVLNPHLRDKHDRFTFAMSKWAKYYIDRPLINIYAESLRRWIEEAYGIKIASNKKFSAVLSHDIDIPYYYGRFRTEMTEILNSVRGNGKFSGIPDLRNYFAYLFGIHRDPYDTYSYFQEQEGKRGIPATYFVMLSKDNAWGLGRKKYSRTLKEIHRNGNEIALHPGYGSFEDITSIAKEKGEVEKISGTSIKGARNHFLRFKMFETFYQLLNFGLSYDATIGFPDREGFRCGICTPYKPFDIHKRQVIDIIEIPLIVMDGTLGFYRELNPDDALETVKRLIDEALSYNGVITFNWHNTFLIAKNESWRDIYEKTLESLVERNPSFLTCEQIANQWKECWD